ncbi:expressed unknown protein [Seminavis robusta]|uniref:Uncharacterized protein n=1 Tax=Seminavis robusta TaxID=568900 RepID=A0A9N8D9Y9_9STRA|nr:expressed unknown protein [Seminavis robusta]|eukprot:Sro7_g006240.1 n/a (250) ;mRNA; r:203805-204554
MASITNNKSNNDRPPSSSRSLAEDGLRVLDELKRVLFFTDLDTMSDEEKQAAGLAMDDLDRWLSSQDKVGNVSIKCYATTKDNSTDINNKTSEDEKEESKHEDLANSSIGSTGTAANEMVALRDLLMVLRSRMDSTYKEAERVVFFTDLDDRSVVSSNSDSAVNTAVVKLQQMLQQIERTVAKQLNHMGESTKRAYKEAERTVFFTDVPEGENKPRSCPNLGTTGASSLQNPQQGVMRDLERRMLFTDV